MEKLNNFRIYVAGPEVFRPDAEEYLEAVRKACVGFNFEALIPTDNIILDEFDNIELSKRIYLSNVKLLNSADAILVSSRRFRGPSMDVGTAFELGYAAAMGIPAFSYSSDLPSTYKNEVYMEDRSDNWKVEDFGLPDNLMVIHSCESRSSSLIEALAIASRYLLNNQEIRKSED